MSDFKKIVAVHNNFVEAIYSLDFTAKKLLLSVILHLTENNKIEISREELIREVGIDLGRKDKVERELPIRELMTKLITIRNLENSDFKIYQLLKATEYKDGILRTSVYKELLPYFIDVKDKLFTQFNILNIKPLTSIYAIRIYEMCKQFDGTGWLTLELEELRKRMKLEKQYTRIFDFKKWVLNVAVNQINKNTDIDISYKLRKEGKAYKFIDFSIKKKYEKLNDRSAKLFDNKVSEKEAIKSLLGRKIYVQDKLFFFTGLVLKEGKYQICVEDTNKQKALVPTINVSVDGALETVKKMMEDKETK